MLTQDTNRALIPGGYCEVWIQLYVVSSLSARLVLTRELLSWSADHWSFLSGCEEQEVFSQQLVSFYIWKLKPSSQERLMGKQIKQLRCKCIMKVSRRSTTFSDVAQWASLFIVLFIYWTWALKYLRLTLVQRQGVIKNSQRAGTLRKPLQRADTHLPSWPLWTHCAGAWLVVMDPFNSQEKEVEERSRKHTEWVWLQLFNFQLSILSLFNTGLYSSRYIVCLLSWVETWRHFF